MNLSLGGQAKYTCKTIVDYSDFYKFNFEIIRTWEDAVVFWSMQSIINKDDGSDDNILSAI